MANAIHEIMTTDFLYPQQVITDRGSEFMSKEVQAAFARFGILVEYIPTAEHHLNLVERAHHSLWDIIRAIWMQIKKGSWVLVLREGMPAPEGDRIPNRKLSCGRVHSGLRGWPIPPLRNYNVWMSRAEPSRSFWSTPPRSDSTNAPSGTTDTGAPSSDLASWLTSTSLSLR